MKLIVSNHKDDFELNDVIPYSSRLSKLNYPNINLVICPNNKFISYFTDDNYELGSQDILLANNKIKYAIIGHSDMRKRNKETDEEINSKIKQVLEKGIMPILCIGEKDEYLTNIQVEEVLKSELTKDLKDINKKVVIAYEPIWAIRSGKVPDYDVLELRIRFIKEYATNLLTAEPIILYGGSVNDKNILELKNISNIDGYLIGSASLDIDKLKNIMEAIK